MGPTGQNDETAREVETSHSQWKPLKWWLGRITMIIALAGRRIDAPDTAVPCFPLARSATVRERILTFLREQHATALVSAAA